MSVPWDLQECWERPNFLRERGRGQAKAVGNKTSTTFPYHEGAKCHRGDPIRPITLAFVQYGVFRETQK